MEEAGLRWGSGWALTVSRIFLGRRKSILGERSIKSEQMHRGRDPESTRLARVVSVQGRW